MGLPKSRLSRRVAELKERLGARLLQRTTRQLQLTSVGERYLRHCQAMLLEAEMADEAVASITSEPRGRLRVSCPVGLARHFLMDAVNRFLAAYPQVQLDISLVNRRVDLINENIDVALRVREPGDEEPELATGELVRLLPQWSTPGGYLQAVYPHRRGLLPAVRAWITHMDSAFQGYAEPYI